MEIYTDENKFQKFLLFINENKNDLSREDIIQLYDGGLINNNKKVIDYLLKEYKYLLEEEYITKSMLCLVEPKYMDIVKVFYNNNMCLKNLYEKVVISYIEVLNSVYNNEMIISYLKYIVFLLNRIDNPSIGIVKDNLVYNKHNLQDIVNLIDVIILFGGKDVIIEQSDHKLLFGAKDSNVSDIMKKLDTYIINIIKDEMRENDITIIINKLRKRNKIKFITKIKDNFYVYNDTVNNWCLDNNNITYIKKNKTNPLNGDNIPEYVINTLLS